MEVCESFSQCLQKLLKESGLTASAVAKLVGFRSRNSIFRILNNETSTEVDARFLSALRQALGGRWPERNWVLLENALDVKRVGREQHMNNHFFCSAVSGDAESRAYMVEMDGEAPPQLKPLAAFLKDVCRRGRISVVISGCCEQALTSVLASCMGEAASEGRLAVRHYIDIRGGRMVRNIVGVLPLPLSAGVAQTPRWHPGRPAGLCGLHGTLCPSGAGLYAALHQAGRPPELRTRRSAAGHAQFGI